MEDLKESLNSNEEHSHKLSTTDLKWIKLMHWCHKHLGCHQMPERSFFIRGYQMPICARCTGIAIGYFLGIISYFIFYNPYILLLTIPLILDGTIQYFTKYRSTNIKRLMTGILFGIAIMSSFIRFIMWLITKLKLDQTIEQIFN